MIRSLIISQARKLANDTDATNPFHSDALIHAFIDQWEISLAKYLKWPRKQQTISWAAGEGGPAGTSKDIDTDILTILSCYWEPSDTSLTTHSRLQPRTEQQMRDENPAWRSSGNASGKPSRWVLEDAVARAVSEYTKRTITIDKNADEAFTMRIVGIQTLASSTDGTKAPVFQVPFHETAVYFCASKMYLPRNSQKAGEYDNLYRSERRRIKSESPEIIDGDSPVWDGYDIYA